MERNNVVCRLCLVEKNDPSTMLLLNRFAELQDAILNVTSVEVLVDPVRNVYLCDDCETQIRVSVAFRERCLMNDAIFRNKVWECPLAEDTDESLSINHVEIISILEETKCKFEHNTDEIRAKDQLNDNENKSNESKESRESGSNLLCSNAHRTRRIACVRCGKMIISSNMSQHLRTHDPVIPKTCCSYCGQTFKDSRRLSLHINSKHTHEIKYTCEICGKTYLRPYSLREHRLAKHSDVKRYSCNICHQMFESWAQKHHHYKMSHTTAKPYECPHCDWAFKFKGDLTLHIRTHTGEKPFKCDICGKAFNKSYNVVIHKKSHRNGTEDVKHEVPAPNAIALSM